MAVCGVLMWGRPEVGRGVLFRALRPSRLWRTRQLPVCRVPAACAAVLDRERSLVLEPVKGTEERRVSRLVADEPDDVLLVEHLRELGENVAEVVEESAGRARRLGGCG